MKPSARERESADFFYLAREANPIAEDGRRAARSKRKPTWAGGRTSARTVPTCPSVRPPHCSALLRCPLLPLGTTTTALRSGVICPAASAPRPTHASVTCLSSFPPSLVSLGCPAFEHILTLSPHSETGQVKTNSEGRAGHSPFAMALGRFSRLCGIYGR